MNDACQPSEIRDACTLIRLARTHSRDDSESDAVAFLKSYRQPEKVRLMYALLYVAMELAERAGTYGAEQVLDDLIQENS